MDRDNPMQDDTQPTAVRTEAEIGAAPASEADHHGLTIDTTTVAIWLVIVVAIVGFLLLAEVTVYPEGVDRRMRVSDVWAEMADSLPDVSSQIVLELVYALAIAVTLIGSFAAILIALAARSPGANGDGSTPVDSNGRGQLDAPGNNG